MVWEAFSRRSRSKNIKRTTWCLYPLMKPLWRYFLSLNIILSRNGRNRLAVVALGLHLYLKSRGRTTTISMIMRRASNSISNSKSKTSRQSKRVKTALSGRSKISPRNSRSKKREKCKYLSYPRYSIAPLLTLWSQLSRDRFSFRANKI